MAIFEDNYRRSKYISTTDRNKLAEKMDLNPKQLLYWWRNRRQKDRKQNEPKKKQNVCHRSTSAAPTPSPTPSNHSSSCSNQWQPPYIQSTNQPINSQLQNVGMQQYQDYFSMPYQSPPVQYMTQSNHLPHIESNWYPVNGQMGPYSYATNGNMLGNSTSPSCYYEENTNTMNGHFTQPSYSSTQFDRQVKVEPLHLTLANQFDEAISNCTELDGLNSYWQESTSELLQYFPF